MITLALEECALVSARPTTGKSVLALNADNRIILDTDYLTFDALRDWLTPEDFSKFLNDHNRVGTTANGCKIMMLEMVYQFFMQFDIPDLTWLTNLCPGPTILDSMRDRGKLVYVTRDPDDAWRIFKEREEQRGKPLRINESDVKKWYQVPDWAFDAYDEVITLEEGEYLCDVFGIEARITDLAHVDDALSREFREVYRIPFKERKFPFL